MASKKIDTQIQTLIGKIREEAAQLDASKSSAPDWITNCKYTLHPITLNSMPIQLRSSSLEQLIEIMADAIKEDSARSAARHMLGVKGDVLINGYTLAQWTHDALKRRQQIERRARRIELTSLETSLKAIMSEDQRRTEAFDSILSRFESRS